MSDDLAEDGLLSSFSVQHAAAFFAALNTFLNAYNPATTTDGADLKLINSMGAIVSSFGCRKMIRRTRTDRLFSMISSTRTFLLRRCSIRTWLG